MSRPIRDLTKIEFGKLIPLFYEKRPAYNRNRVFWFCKCACGGEIWALASSLVNGHIRSCGCIRGKYVNDHTMTKATWNAIVRQSESGRDGSIRRSKSGRVIRFYLNMHEVQELFDKQNWRCAQTGDRLYFTKNFVDSNASLDRINSEGDYTIDNVQWVTKDYNWMKQFYSNEHILMMSHKIVRWNRLKEKAKKEKEKNGQASIEREYKQCDIPFKYV